MDAYLLGHGVQGSELFSLVHAMSQSLAPISIIQFLMFERYSGDNVS